MLAAVIAGHHAGLADGLDLDARLRHPLPAYAGWQAHGGPVPAPAALAPTRPFALSHREGFSAAFLTRMLFSCLVDADALETERFYTADEVRTVDRGPFRNLATPRGRLDAHMADLAEGAAATDLNALRAEVLAQVKARAALPPGLFTLTVPTGGGKTLASLSFALDQAVRHGLRRIVYLIPFAGAWIETPPRPHRAWACPVAPRAGAWIETASARRRAPPWRSRSPGGSVDRNNGLDDEFPGPHRRRSPRESVDRNLLPDQGGRGRACRSPRGSVDRNCQDDRRTDRPPGSLRARERGSKLRRVRQGEVDLLSLLARERGSKLPRLGGPDRDPASLPARKRGSKPQDVEVLRETSGRSLYESVGRNLGRLAFRAPMLS